METTAQLKYFRTSPRKIRLVTDLLRGLDVKEARTQLQYLSKRAAGSVLKLLNSAVANAEHNFNLSEEDLYIKNILVNGGPSLKRLRPRAMGRATPIMKRTSHITIVLDQKEISERKPELKKEPTKPKAPLSGGKAGKEIPSEVEKKITPPEVTEKPIPAAKKQPQPRKVSPRRPYRTSPQAKKRFFSRQTFGNIKKMFRRKSI